jgi:GntR family transcriptional regulator
MTATEQPMYRQIATRLRAQIHSGELSEIVPTEHQLMADFDVSRNTIRRALDELTHEGLITPGRSRSGRRVRKRRPLTVYASRTELLDRRVHAAADAWVTDVREQGGEPGQTIAVAIEAATRHVARWLQVDEGADVVVRRRLRTINGEPDNLADTYYPLDIAREIPEISSPVDVKQGIVALMRERGYIQERYDLHLQWRPPTPEEAQILEISPGVSVLVETRTGYTSERPVKASIHTWPGDTHDMVFELLA